MEVHCLDCYQLYGYWTKNKGVINVSNTYVEYSDAKTSKSKSLHVYFRCAKQKPGISSYLNLLPLFHLTFDAKYPYID